MKARLPSLLKPSVEPSLQMHPVRPFLRLHAVIWHQPQIGVLLWMVELGAIDANTEVQELSLRVGGRWNKPKIWKVASSSMLMRLQLLGVARNNQELRTPFLALKSWQ